MRFLLLGMKEKHMRDLKNQLGRAQGRGQGAGPETGRAQHDGGLLRDENESYMDYRTSAPSN
jgi:hypothetical protein